MWEHMTSAPLTKPPLLRVLSSLGKRWLEHCPISFRTIGADRDGDLRGEEEMKGEGEMSV